MYRVLKILSISAIVGMIGCSAGKEESSKRSDEIIGDDGSTIDAEVLEDAGGLVRAKIVAFAAATQVVRASSSSRISGATIKVPPRSFTEDTEIALAEGSPVVHQKNLDSLGIGDSVRVVSVGPPVVMTWSFDEDSLRPFILSLPKPAVLATNLETPIEESTTSLSVVYRTNIADSSKTKLGILNGDSLDTSNVVSLEFSSYGIFQVVLFDSPADTTKEIEDDGKLDTNITANDSEPGAFQVSGPSEPIAGSGYVPATSHLTWDPARHADSYKVALSGSEDCSSPVKEFPNTTTVSQTLAGLDSGIYYACVSAVNSVGESAATNSGNFKIQLDATIPPQPSKPAASAIGINVTFSWPEITEVGPSGLAFYELQVGTSPGDATYYNGTVVGDPEKEIVGDSGVTLYGRVRAIDQAGNVGPWSESSVGTSL